MQQSLRGLGMIAVVAALAAACSSGENPSDPTNVDATEFIHPGTQIVEALEVDLDGDGQDEIALETLEFSGACGPEFDPEFGAGKHDLVILAYDPDTRDWQVVFEVLAPGVDMGEVTMLTLVDLDPGPASQVLWERSALGGCGNNPDKDLYVIGWDGTTAVAHLHTQFGGWTEIRDDRLVLTMGNWAGREGTMYPNECQVAVYGWTETRLELTALSAPLVAIDSWKACEEWRWD